MSDPNPTGLSDNSAGALAYVTFVPAIVFLALPPYNASPNVRFHAWQSIFFTIAAVVISIALGIVLAIAGWILPFGFFFLRHLIWLLFDLAMFVLWLLCVLRALNGVRFKIPILGDLAEQQAKK